jgi:hypothetical protein
MLCVKLVEKINEFSTCYYLTEKQQLTILNCTRLLTRLIPYIFEHNDWRSFFWSTNSDSMSPNHSRIENQSSNNNSTTSSDSDKPVLGERLLKTIIHLLFIPDFTVSSHRSSKENKTLNSTIDSCEYIWECGVGFSKAPIQNYQHDSNRIELLKLLLTTFSQTIYSPPSVEYHLKKNLWINYFTSFENQHALPLFTSILNIVFSYDPVGYGLPYNYLLFNDSRETLVEVCSQILCVTLESQILNNQQGEDCEISSSSTSSVDNISSLHLTTSNKSNLFISYIARIHRDEDFAFILKGFIKLLNNPMIQTFLPGSCKKISFHQEMLILFWKFCDYNKVKIQLFSFFDFNFALSKKLFHSIKNCLHFKKNYLIYLTIT